MEASQNEFLLYEIKDSDTLGGLALDLGVSKAYIKKTNKLFNDEILHLKHLKFPKNEALAIKLKKIQSNSAQSEMMIKCNKENFFVNKMKIQTGLNGDVISDLYKLYRGR